jgi:hypothetical protein
MEFLDIDVTKDSSLLLYAVKYSNYFTVPSTDGFYRKLSPFMISFS